MCNNSNEKKQDMIYDIKKINEKHRGQVMPTKPDRRWLKSCSQTSIKGSGKKNELMRFDIIST